MRGETNGIPPGPYTSPARLGETAPPGRFLEGAIPYGVLDMAGNVADRVVDTFDPAYDLVAPGGNPLGPSLGLHIPHPDRLLAVEKSWSKVD